MAYVPLNHLSINLPSAETSVHLIQNLKVKQKQLTMEGFLKSYTYYTYYTY